MVIVPMQLNHIKQMAELERLCFSLPWSENSFKSELDNPVAYYYVAAEGDTVLAYAGVQMIIDEGYITNVATHPDHRRKGLARELLLTIEEKAMFKELDFLTLEVRAGNTSAQRLYEGLGYEVAGVLKKHYYKPVEDAWIMTKRLRTND